MGQLITGPSFCQRGHHIMTKPVMVWQHIKIWSWVPTRAWCQDGLTDQPTDQLTGWLAARLPVQPSVSCEMTNVSVHVLGPCVMQEMQDSVQNWAASPVHDHSGVYIFPGLICYAWIHLVAGCNMHHAVFLCNLTVCPFIFFVSVPHLKWRFQ
jgi:hypothetical protein